MLATNNSEIAFITAHPFDLSAAKTQAAIKKVEALPAYRLIVDRDEEAQKLLLSRAKLINAAVQMPGATGLPMREFDPKRDSFPCDYCEWKSRCMAPSTRRTSASSCRRYPSR
jgi:hypothetical protein